MKEYKYNATHNVGDGSIRLSWKCAKKILASAGISLAALMSFPFLLELFGFTALGPQLGSVAAKWQSSIGSVEAGSLFSILQSIGMAGLTKLPFVVIPSAAGAVAGAICGLDTVTKNGTVTDLKEVKDETNVSGQNTGEDQRKCNILPLYK